MRVRMMVVMAVLLLVAGCATPSPARKFTTEAEALAAYGEPVTRWKNDDGTTTLEYSNQPNGHVTMMITVDQGGIVLHQYNALSEDNLARVKQGMTKEEVSRLLGRHRSVQTFPNSGEEVWDWNIANELFGPASATLFNVHFVQDKVVRTSRSYIYPHDAYMASRWYGPAFGPPPPYYYPFPSHRRWPYSRWPRHPYYSPWYFY